MLSVEDKGIWTCEAGRDIDWGCDSVCDAVTRSVSSRSCGKAPLPRKSGSVVDRGRKLVDAELDPVAVAEDMVVLDWLASRAPTVPDESVFGEAVCDSAPPTLACMLLSPPVGTIPL